jgi:negative regulator of sigma E activity
MNQLREVIPSIVNIAVSNVALNYKLIHKNTSATSANNNGYVSSYIEFDFVNLITEMRDLSKSIEDGGGRATYTEYFKLLFQFANALAAAKKISVEAAQEIIITEVSAIQNNLIDRQTEAEALQKQSKQLLKFFLRTAAAMGAFAVLWISINAGLNIFNQRFLNIEEIERLRTDNAQLQEQNKQLKVTVDEFDTFKKERAQVNKIKAENETLRKRNSNLNDRLVQCKKPFWQSRNCN